MSAPPDEMVADWMFAQMPTSVPKRTAFLADAELARLLLGADAFDPASELFDELASELAEALGAWGDRLVAAVLEARAVR